MCVCGRGGGLAIAASWYIDLHSSGAICGCVEKAPPNPLPGPSRDACGRRGRACMCVCTTVCMYSRDVCRRACIVHVSRGARGKLLAVLERAEN